MDWEQKYVALMTLVGRQNICLLMLEPGNWCLGVGAAVSGGTTRTYPMRRAQTPQEAVNMAWHDYVTGLADNEYIIVSGSDEKTQRVRWNGFMWKPVKLPEAAV